MIKKIELSFGSNKSLELFSTPLIFWRVVFFPTLKQSDSQIPWNAIKVVGGRHCHTGVLKLFLTNCTRIMRRILRIILRKALAGGLAPRSPVLPYGFLNLESSSEKSQDSLLLRWARQAMRWTEAPPPQIWLWIPAFLCPLSQTNVTHRISHTSQMQVCALMNSKEWQTPDFERKTKNPPLSRHKYMKQAGQVPLPGLHNEQIKRAAEERHAKQGILWDIHRFWDLCSAVF